MRLRASATLDKDEVSPVSIEACNSFLTKILEERADTLGIAINWNSWHTYSRRKVRGDLVVVQWAKVIKP